MLFAELTTYSRVVFFALSKSTVQPLPIIICVRYAIMYLPIWHITYKERVGCVLLEIQRKPLHNYDIVKLQENEKEILNI